MVSGWFPVGDGEGILSAEDSTPIDAALAEMRERAKRVIDGAQLPPDAFAQIEAITGQSLDSVLGSVLEELGSLRNVNTATRRREKSTRSK